MKKRESTEKKVFSYMEKHHMIAPGDKIVLGVSGGADSVCLLFLLLEYAKTVPVTLAVVHVNHKIRPDAGEDAAYVRNLCEANGLSFYLVEKDVREKARIERCSEEDAGRRVRYEAFERVAGEVGATKIAVAHNSDDNAETMLMHLFRGSGIGGLSGIAPVRELNQGENPVYCCSNREAGKSKLQLIRPILCLRRQEIEEYLQEREISWRVDSTNESDDYTRNKIRHHVMSYVEQNIASNATGRMQRTAELLQETESYLEQQTREALQACLVTAPGMVNTGESCFPAESYSESKNQIILQRDTFQTIHPALQKRILLQLAKELSPTGKDISQIHVDDMLKVISREGNHSVNLPFGIVVKKQYDYVILEQGKEPIESEYAKSEKGQCMAISMEQDGLYDLREWGNLDISHIFQEKWQELPRNKYTKWFDYDKINGCLEIRTRRQGDYLTISDGAGSTRHKSLKDYMITEKIPKELRDRIPVLADGNHVIWLIGYRISEDFKVDENTKHILQAKLRCKREQKTEEEDDRAD